jgi:hypothetical protein
MDVGAALMALLRASCARSDPGSNKLAASMAIVLCIVSNSSEMVVD